MARDDQTTELEILADHRHESAEVTAVLPEVVARLQAQAEQLATPLRKTFTGHPLPSVDELAEMVELLRSVIFPGYHGTRDITEESIAYHMGAALHRAALIMVDEVHRGLCFDCKLDSNERLPERCLQRAKKITTEFLLALPELRRMLALDAVAAYEGDPAAASPSEAIFSYPGVHAITSHRIAHELYRQGVPLIPRIIAEHAHSTTGIDIHPGAQIGERFFIDHGTGVVIGETSVLGDRVRIYQGVTLGAKSFPLDDEGKPIKGVARHPIVEDDVTIYSGATILGRITIGRGAVIGGNLWVTHDVPPGTVLSQSRPTTERFENGGGI
jgi:serine O-acetyltransferase